MDVGLVAIDDEAGVFLDWATTRLRQALSGALPRFTWHVSVVEAPLGEEACCTTLELLDHARDVLLRRDFDFAFAVTGEFVPERSPRLSTLASQGLSSAVVPLRLIGDTGDPAGASDAVGRFDELVLHMLGLLCGLSERDDAKSVMRRWELAADSEPVGAYGADELAHLESRLEAVAAGNERTLRAELGIAATYFKVIFTKPWAVLRKAFANRPWRLILRLHKLVFPAVVAVPLALLSTELWQIGVNMNRYRLMVIGVGVVVFMTVFIVIKQKLLKRSAPGENLEQVAVFNLSAVLSILTAVAIVLAAIFVLTLFITTSLFPRKAVAIWLETGVVKNWYYIRVSFFIACLASFVGWLGAGFTDADDFRMMLYTGSKS